MLVDQTLSRFTGLLIGVNSAANLRFGVDEQPCKASNKTSIAVIIYKGRSFVPNDNLVIKSPKAINFHLQESLIRSWILLL